MSGDKSSTRLITLDGEFESQEHQIDCAIMNISYLSQEAKRSNANNSSYVMSIPA